ncbi:Uncharacterised protein [Staphylococcus aureus]|nr:Uncharacterised protein [Staphylococcus aureus]
MPSLSSLVPVSLSTNGVSIVPGAIALARMPSLPYSIAMDFVKLITAPFAALYPERYKSAACPENEDVLTIEPPLVIIKGNIIFVIKNVPRISTFIILSYTSVGYS